MVYPFGPLSKHRLFLVLSACILTTENANTPRRPTRGSIRDDPRSCGERAKGTVGAVCVVPERNFTFFSESEVEEMQSKDSILFCNQVKAAQMSLRPGLDLQCCQEAAEETSKRFLAGARLLPAGSFIGFQFAAGSDDGARKAYAISSEAANLTPKDFAWIFEPCAVAAPAESADAALFGEGRRIYSVSGLKPEKDAALMGDALRNLLTEMKEVNANFRLYAGPEETRCRMLLSLPDPITLRMRAMLSLAFPGALAEELRETGAPEALSYESFSSVFTQLLYAQISEWLDASSEELLTADEYLFLDEDDCFTGGMTDSTSIEELNLSVRACNNLKRAGILTLGRLRCMTEDELLEIRNLGRKCVDEILDKISHLEISPEPAPQAAPDYAQMLADLVGLSNVKEQVVRITAFARMQKVLRESGKAAIPMVLNMEFIGNPGTAKTTVARILAGLLHKVELLPSDELVEVGRADLVARYEGQTADKVKALFRRAKGKLLFIDEAYSLAEGFDGAFGDEAINTIVQEMENNREDTVLIFAGYPKQMEAFFDRNPGLRSRVPFQIRFCDYSAEELRQITEIEAKKRGFTCSEQAMEFVASICAKAAKSATAGNGRFCRNLAEGAVLRYAERVFGENADAAEPDYILQKEDFFCPDIVPAGESANKIGFAVN